jgi:hypothetical protein
MARFWSSVSTYGKLSSSSFAIAYRRKGITFHHLTARVQVEQILGNFLHRFFDAALVSCPRLPAEIIERRLAAIRADVASEPVRLMDGDVENVAAVIFNGEILPFVAVQLSLDQTREASNAVIDVDNIIAPPCKSA